MPPGVKRASIIFMLPRLIPWLLVAALLLGLALLSQARNEGRPPRPCTDTPVALLAEGREAVYCLGAPTGQALAEAAGLQGPCHNVLSAEGALRAGEALSLVAEGATCRVSRRSLSASQALLLGLPLELNTASAEDLEALPGIGPGVARAIVEDRARRGHFRSVDELERVRGIGPKALERLRGFLVVRGAPGAGEEGAGGR